jgi:hypothetical protein
VSGKRFIDDEVASGGGVCAAEGAAVRDVNPSVGEEVGTGPGRHSASECAEDIEPRAPVRCVHCC